MRRKRTASTPARPETAPESIYRERLAAIRATMAKLRLDAYLIFNRREQFWATGFTGEDGMTLITEDRVVLLTDGRFDETADLEAPWARKVIRKERSAEATARELQRFDVSRIGYDPAHVTVAMHAAHAKALRPTRLVAASGVIGNLRLIKSPAEIEAIRAAIGIGQEAMIAVRAAIRPGLSERRIAAMLAYEMTNRGAEEEAFRSIVAAGSNASLPHYAPGDRTLREGELLLIDWGARRNGYVSDLTRVFWIGDIPAAWRKPYLAVLEAHDAAIAAAKPGMKASALDAVARNSLKKAGLAERFTHSLGHGIGLDVHEAPRLARKSTHVLQPGMVVTIEPGVYIPGAGGIRIEDDILITAQGCERLSSLPTNMDWGLIE